MFEEQQQQRGDGLDDDFFVAVHVNAQLHALEDCDAEKITNTFHTLNSLRCIHADSMEMLSTAFVTLSFIY